jgi:hypothetical protein
MSPIMDFEYMSSIKGMSFAEDIGYNVRHEGLKPPNPRTSGGRYPLET